MTEYQTQPFTRENFIMPSMDPEAFRAPDPPDFFSPDPTFKWPYPDFFSPDPTFKWPYPDSINDVIEELDVDEPAPHSPVFDTLNIFLPCGTKAFVDREAFFDVPRTIFFDADGTLRHCLVDGQPCPNKDDEWVVDDYASIWIDNHISKMQQVPSNQDKMYIVSNQGGVDFGYLTYSAAKNMLTKLAIKLNIPSENVLMSADSGSHDLMRKPNPGLLDVVLSLASPLARSRAVMVGDLESDKQVAYAAGVTFIWASELFQW